MQTLCVCVRIKHALEFQVHKMVGVTQCRLVLRCAVGKPIAGQCAACILTMGEPITTHYAFQMSVNNNGAFHFKVVRRKTSL